MQEHSLSIDSILQKHFQLQDFRKGQRPVLESVLSGRDAMAVMPTGGGKSLCYQLPAMATGRLVVVISPLIALMKDQVRSLREIGIPSGCIHSGQSEEEKREVFASLRKGGPFLLYLSPERVQKPGFAQWLASQDVGLFAIDESHCVSQWGHDFREDYSKLQILRQLKPQVPILALTATATPQVLDDIVRSLEMKRPDRHIRGFYRPNLFYQVMTCANEEEKVEALREAIRRTPEGRCIIYCGTRQNCEVLSHHLASYFEGVGYYHAGLSNEERAETQKKLENEELRILFATNAFGMGIDYPNVRLVAHYQMPANIESFYQEMGRAGRDGQPSLCLLLYAKKDRGLQSFFIQQSKAPAAVLSARWRALDAMVQFSEGGECRHAGILTYFRDSERIRSCGHCDICDPKGTLMVERPQAPPKEIKKRSKKKDYTEGLQTPGSELRAEMLREWRKSFADTHDMPAFMVFSNRTMVDLANKNPQTLDELKAVYGFGPHKTEAIGSLVLAELKKCE